MGEPVNVRRHVSSPMLLRGSSVYTVGAYVHPGVDAFLPLSLNVDAYKVYALLLLPPIHFVLYVGG